MQLDDKPGKHVCGPDTTMPFQARPLHNCLPWGWKLQVSNDVPYLTTKAQISPAIQMTKPL